MSVNQYYTGQAARVAGNLPTSKTLSAATNATPIVVTTTTNHGLQTNEIITITGVTGNTAANGTFIVGSITPTTATLLVYPTGANTTGSGAYTGGPGTLQSLGFGTPFPRPRDGVDGERAATVGVPIEALGDFTAYLMMIAGPNGTVFVRRAGDTMTGDLHFAQGTVLAADGSGADIAGTWTVVNDMHFAQTRALIGDGTGGKQTGIWHYPTGVAGFDLRDAPSYLSDADHTLDTNSGAQQFVMLTSPGANRIITLRQGTSPVPPEGLWFELTVILGTSSHTVGLQREGSSDYVAVIGDGVGTSPFGSSNLAGTARVQVVSGVWRLISVGGVAFYGSDA